MRFGHSYPPPGLVRFSRPGKVTTSGGVLKAISHGGTTYVSALDGDRYFFEFFLDGSETLVELGTYKDVNRGIFDLYVNGVLDSSGYDDYAASPAAVFREITLAVPIVSGRNTIELRSNGKNVASSGYGISTYGMSVQ